MKLKLFAALALIASTIVHGQTKRDAPTPKAGQEQSVSTPVSENTLLWKISGNGTCESVLSLWHDAYSLRR